MPIIDGEIVGLQRLSFDFDTDDHTPAGIFAEQLVARDKIARINPAAVLYRACIDMTLRAWRG